jgi:hypothetical protein
MNEKKPLAENERKEIERIVGKPWAFAIETPLGDWLDGEDCIFSDEVSAQDRADDLNDSFADDRYKVVPLYRIDSLDVLRRPHERKAAEGTTNRERAIGQEGTMTNERVNRPVRTIKRERVIK